MAALPRSLDEGETEETIVGPAIAIRGRIEGQEDLRVEGRIEGSISLTETLYHELRIKQSPVGVSDCGWLFCSSVRIAARLLSARGTPVIRGQVWSTFSS